jgi:hypothetical protein
VSVALSAAEKTVC